LLADEYRSGHGRVEVVDPNHCSEMEIEDEAAPPWAQPSEISFGDYVRACRALEADASACLGIARLLGLVIAVAPEPAPQVEVPSEPKEAGPVVVGDSQVFGKPGAAGVTPKEEPVAVLKQKPVPPSDDEQEIPADLTPLGQAQVDSSLNQLPDIAKDESVLPPPEFVHLFKPQQTRTMLSRALARRAGTGPWDLGRIIEMCARGEPILHAPRLPEPTLSGGVQLLVDRSDAMMVFAQDQSSLEQAIGKLVGEEKLEVLYFDRFPARARSVTKDRWASYEKLLPPPGTVVAILSDLGIAHAPWLPTRPAPAQWRDLALKLRRRGCPVVAFVPYHTSRWPSELRRALTIIHWDRRTRTSAIRARVGSGLTVKG
jgi:hypothetical protein